MREKVLPAAAGRSHAAGQITVELLLVLPIFMTLLFFIMEMGNIGFQTILAHHCGYELARVGSLVAGTNGADSGGGAALAQAKMENMVKQMFPSSPGITVESEIKNNSIPPDPQSLQQSRDLVVKLHYQAKLIFPISSYVLEVPKDGKRTRNVEVIVRMPVEQPYKQ